MHIGEAKIYLPVSSEMTHLCLGMRPTCVSKQDPPLSLRETHLCL